MDDIDKRLLSLLAKNSRVPLKTLAEQSFLSPPAVSARLERMIQEGIIASYGVRINYSILDYIIAFICVKAEFQMQEELEKFIQNSNNVLECNRLEGDYNILLKTFFEDEDEFNTFLHELDLYGKAVVHRVVGDTVYYRDIFDEKGK